MRKKENKKSWPRSAVEAAGTGAVSGFLFSMLLFFIAASLISKEKLPDNIMTELSLGISFVGALVGGFFASKLLRLNTAGAGFLVGCGMIVIRALCGAANNNGTVIDAYALETYGLFLLGGFIGGMASRKRKRSRR